MNIDQACCVFGHRTISDNKEMRTALYRIMENLILEKNINTFLFGSKSRFNDLCLEIVTKLKAKHPHIKRIYVRAECPQISESYKSYLLEQFEDSYFPEKLWKAGRAIYVERNFEMIRKSRFCIVYYDPNCAPTHRKSGTELALLYAIKKERPIIRFPL